PLHRRATALVRDLIRNPSDFVLIPGYHRGEYWAMLAACILMRRRRGVCVDSTSNDREKGWWREKAKSLFFSRCDGFFCYGTRSREYVASYGVNPDIIFDGCQSAALPHEYDSQAIREHYRKGEFDYSGPPRFLYVGRLSEE